MGRMPIFLLLAFLAIVSVNFGLAAIWAIAGVAFVALVVLIFAMRRQGDFRGPGVLLEDARERRIRARLVDRESDGDVVYVEEEK